MICLWVRPPQKLPGVRVSSWTVVPSMKRPELSIMSLSGNVYDAWLTIISK